MASIAEFLRLHFFHVAPNLLVGILGVAIIIERTKALFWTYPMQGKKKFFERLRELVMEDRISDAVALCNSYASKPIVEIVKEGLIRANQPEETIQDGLALAVGEATQKIQKRTSFLSTIANVATLIGLFGTIAGLIQSFEAVGHADAQQKAGLLAEGISVAMNATMIGLGIAIPCMLAFSFLMNRTNRLGAEIDHAAIKTLDLLRQRFYRVDGDSRK